MCSAEQLAVRLVDDLWSDYTRRVPSARLYAELVRQKGGLIQHDHLNLRCFADGPGPGLSVFAFVLESLGYLPKKTHSFPHQHLTAVHFEHPSGRLPKVFVSQLHLGALPVSVARLIRVAIRSATSSLDNQARHDLAELQAKGTLPDEQAGSLGRALVRFFGRPWAPPLRRTVEAAASVSDFAAWTLLFGHSVRHFAADVRLQAVPDWPTLETTVAELRRVGVPVQPGLEGRPGGLLRQALTEEVVEACPVTEETGETGLLDWPYAGYALTERGVVVVNGQFERFEGFLDETPEHILLPLAG